MEGQEGLSLVDEEEFLFEEEEATLGHRRHVEEQVGGREWGGIFSSCFCACTREARNVRNTNKYIKV